MVDLDFDVWISSQPWVVSESRMQCRLAWDAAKHAGFAAGIEAAAKVAEEHAYNPCGSECDFGDNCLPIIAAKVRALAAATSPPPSETAQ